MYAYVTQSLGWGQDLGPSTNRGVGGTPHRRLVVRCWFYPMSPRWWLGRRRPVFDQWRVAVEAQSRVNVEVVVWRARPLADPCCVVGGCQA